MRPVLSYGMEGVRGSSPRVGSRKPLHFYRLSLQCSVWTRLERREGVRDSSSGGGSQLKPCKYAGLSGIPAVIRRARGDRERSWGPNWGRDGPSWSLPAMCRAARCTLPVLLAAPALEQLLVDPQGQRRVVCPPCAMAYDPSVSPSSAQATIADERPIRPPRTRRRAPRRAAPAAAPQSAVARRCRIRGRGSRARSRRRWRTARLQRRTRTQ